MRISFYNGAIVLALFAAAGQGVHQSAAVDAEMQQAWTDTELPQVDTEQPAEGVIGEDQTMFAQVGAEAQYFKKIVNFAKDAIKTIAPTLSTQNKLNAAAGVVRPLDNDVNIKYTLGTGKQGLAKSMDHLSHDLRHPKPQSSISSGRKRTPRCSDLNAARHHHHHHHRRAGLGGGLNSLMGMMSMGGPPAGAPCPPMPPMMGPPPPPPMMPMASPMPGQPMPGQCYSGMPQPPMAGGMPPGGQLMSCTPMTPNVSAPGAAPSPNPAPAAPASTAPATPPATPPAAPAAKAQIQSSGTMSPVLMPAETPQKQLSQVISEQALF